MCLLILLYYLNSQRKSKDTKGGKVDRKASSNQELKAAKAAPTPRSQAPDATITVTFAGTDVRNNRLILDSNVAKLLKAYQDSVSDAKLKEDRDTERINADYASKKQNLERNIEARTQDLNNEISRYKESKIKALDMDLSVYEKKRTDALNELFEEKRSNLELEKNSDLTKAHQDYLITVEDLNNNYKKQLFTEFSSSYDKMANKCDENKAASLNNTVLSAGNNNSNFDFDKYYEIWKAAGTDNAKNQLVTEAIIEFEKSRAYKEELLHLLHMQDIVKIPDEEYLENHGSKIDRAHVTYQTQFSSCYESSIKVNKDKVKCWCMVSLMNLWSPRHKKDCLKMNSHIMRYIASKTDQTMFAKVHNVFCTENKLYTFMDPLESSKTLDNYVMAMNTKTKNKRRRSVDQPQRYKWKQFTDDEMYTIAIQIVQAIKFLKNVFVAHMNLTPDNIVFIESDPLRIVITGLTRCVIYFTAESDEFCMTPAYEINEPFVEHLPAECFKEQFSARNVDTYSMGYVLYVINELRFPYDQMDSNKSMYERKCTEALVLSGDSNEPLRDLVANITNPNPSARLPNEVVMGHEYFKSRAQ